MEMKNVMSEMFGSIKSGLCRLTIDGNIAVKVGADYKTYNPTQKTFVNCDSFVFDIGDEMFFVVPTNTIVAGDIILVNKEPRYVLDVKDDIITAINYKSGTIENITPASVGLLHPKNLIFKNFDDVEKECQIENYYVSRTYLTRHGKGQIGISGDCECGKEDINPNMVDKTNVPNPNQGTLRYGKFSTEEAELAMERIEEDTGRHLALISQSNLVITHTNEYNDGELERAAEKFRIRTFLSDNETSFKLKEKF